MNLKTYVLLLLSSILLCSLPASAFGATAFRSITLSKELRDALLALPPTYFPLLSVENEAGPELPAAAELSYWRGRLSKSPIESKHFLNEAAQMGHWKAELILINQNLASLQTGLFSDDIKKMILEPLDALSAKKIPEAFVIRAELFAKGLAGQTKDPKKALSAYRRAAELGSVEAMVYLGDALHTLADKRYFALAEHYFKNAYAQKSGAAAFGLGRLLLEQKRLVEAMPVLLQGAEWGNASCLKVLSNLTSSNSAFFAYDQKLSKCYADLSEAATLDNSDNQLNRHITFPYLKKICNGNFLVP